MRTTRKVNAPRLFLAVLTVLMAACGAFQDGFAQNQRRFLVMSAGGSPWLAERFYEGCLEWAGQLDGTGCELAPPTGDVAANMARIENFIASGGSGIILQTYSGDPVYADFIKRAAEAGVPTVVASTSTLEAASAYGDIAVSIIGMSGRSVIEKIEEAVSGVAASGEEFCVLEFKSELPVLSQLNMQISANLEEKGLKPSAACPAPLDDVTDQTLFSAVEDALKAGPVKVFVLPIGIPPDTLADLATVGRKLDKSAVFVSASVSPFDLGRLSAALLFDVQQGKAVEDQVELAPVLQISTQQFCETCDCQSNTTCKDSCRKCR